MSFYTARMTNFTWCPLVLWEINRYQESFLAIKCKYIIRNFSDISRFLTKISVLVSNHYSRILKLCSSIPHFDSRPTRFRPPKIRHFDKDPSKGPSLRRRFREKFKTKVAYIVVSRHVVFLSKWRLFVEATSSTKFWALVKVDLTKRFGFC